MQVVGSDLDGAPLGLITLERVGAQQLLVDGQPVVATRVLGSRVALVLTSRQVCVAATDYWQVLGAAASPDGGAG